MAMANTAIDIRSPAVNNMSSSRPGGLGETCFARSNNSSVVSPIAETTTTISFPARLVSTIRLATRKILAASATDEPPNLATTKPIRPNSKSNLTIRTNRLIAGTVILPNS
ncbi:unannotated protein [freshwater metagenome]|uniref:Unannotated protein n=1 Tax=freshwater metagenome TaxID=449393 RepID=A0A6J5ZNV0_9ZZZZ